MVETKQSHLGGGDVLFKLYQPGLGVSFIYSFICQCMRTRRRGWNRYDLTLLHNSSGYSREDVIIYSAFQSLRARMKTK